MSAYRLPSVSPLTVRSKNRPQFTDEDGPVRLVETELVRCREVTVAVEAKRNADQRLGCGDLGRPDRRPNLGPRRRARRAGPVDRGRHDLCRSVRRSAEVLTVTAVDLLEAGDDLGLRIEREVRVVHVRADGGKRRVEEAVRSHQLDGSLAGSLHLVAEGDALRR